MFSAPFLTFALLPYPGWNASMLSRHMSVYGGIISSYLNPETLEPQAFVSPKRSCAALRLDNHISTLEDGKNRSLLHSRGPLEALDFIQALRHKGPQNDHAFGGMKASVMEILDALYPQFLMFLRMPTFFVKTMPSMQ